MCNYRVQKVKLHVHAQCCSFGVFGERCCVGETQVNRMRCSGDRRNKRTQLARVTHHVSQGWRGGWLNFRSAARHLYTLTAKEIPHAGATHKFSVLGQKDPHRDPRFGELSGDVLDRSPRPRPRPITHDPNCSACRLLWLPGLPQRCGIGVKAARTRARGKFRRAAF